MNDLTSALREALAATGEVDPRTLDAADLALYRACDQRCAETIERLIREHDEAGPAARALLRGFTLRD